MRVPPAAANSSNCLPLSLSEAPQPQSVPKVIVPSASSLTRSPELPSNVYRTACCSPPVARSWPGCSHHGGAAAVDAQVGAVDIARKRAGDERDQVGDLLRPAKAAGGVGEDVGENSRLDRRPVLSPAPAGGLQPVELLHTRGGDDAGTDGVDRDAAAVQMLGQRYGQVEQRRLGSRVVGHG